MESSERPPTRRPLSPALLRHDSPTRRSGRHISFESDGLPISKPRSPRPALNELQFPSESASGQGGAAEDDWVKQSLLFFVMGMSGWWSLNAMMWAESPIYINSKIGTPEGNTITNWLSIACQIGNVFPFLYKGAFNKEQQARILTGSVFMSQLIAVVSCLVCAFWWRDTLEYDGHEHSAVLIVCTLIAGGVGCMSNVTFWALCVRYPGTHCTKAMSVGTTVGGLISTMLATPIGQNAGSDHPRFSVQTFMLIIAAVQVVFMVCFMLMEKPPVQTADSDLTSPDLSGRTPSKVSLAHTRTSSIGSRTASKANLTNFTLDDDENTSIQGGPGGLTSSLLGKPKTVAPGMSKKLQYFVLFIMFLVYGLTYALPSLGPYIVNSYHIKTKLLMWMNVMQQAGDVSGRASTAVPWVPAVPTLLTMTLTVVGISIILILGAIFPAQVPLLLPVDTICVWFIPALFFMYYFLRGYVVTLLYIRVKLDTPKAEAENFSGNMGVAGQAGALLVNIVLFVLINVFDLLGGPPGNAMANTTNITNSTNAMLAPWPQLSWQPIGA